MQHLKTKLKRRQKYSVTISLHKKNLMQGSFVDSLIKFAGTTGYSWFTD